MLIDVNKIIVNDRIRKDYGDLDELAEDIEQNSLLNALVVTPSGNGNGTYVLIAGERRLRAMRDILGYKAVPVNSVGAEDAEQALMMEISENECRKDFTKTERLEYARRLAAIESAKAKERMESGKAIDPRQEIGKGRSADAVATVLGTNRETLRQEQFIENNSDLLDPADFADWDEGKLSTNKAFQRIKAAKELAEHERDMANAQRKATMQTLEETFLESEAMENEITSLKKQLADKSEPKVVEREVEVIPSHIQRRLKSLEKETERLNAEYQKVWQEKMDLDKKLDQANELLGEKDKNDNAQWDIEVLTTATNNYLRQYGGKAWAFDQFYRVDELTQREFEKAITNLASFAQNMVALIADRKQIGANNE